jgi:NDP-sugar pyrophosphorylase family protein
LAGGLATRLRPLTDSVPKALVAVKGEPFIHHQLRLLKKNGVDEVVLCVGHLGELIRDAVGDGADWGLKVSYSFDGATLLGTGGALMKALPRLGDCFFVLYGDSYLPVDFRAVQAAFDPRNADALMTVLSNGNRWDRSNVRFENGLLVEYDKRSARPEMRHIDYGLGIIGASVFGAYASEKAFDLADYYRDLSLRGRLAGFEVATRFYEIGSVKGIEDTEAFLSNKGGS